MFIRDLKVGQDFILTGRSTVYRVSRPVSSEPGNRSVTYVIPGSGDAQEWTFVLPGMTTCTLIGN